MYKHEPIAKKFYDGLDHGKFLGLKCTECGNIEFPPYPACNKCGHVGNIWEELPGDVIVEEIYAVSPMMTIDDFMTFAPIYSAECHMENGIEFVSLIFGVSRKNYEEIRESVPLHAKLVVMPMTGYNTFAVAINGAVPVRKEVSGGMDQAAILKTLSLKKEQKADNGIDGTYKLTVKAMGRTQNAKVSIVVEGESFTGVVDVMDTTVPINDGILKGENFEFTVEAKGAELKFSGKVGDGKMSGTAKFGLIKMTFEGVRQ